MTPTSVKAFVKYFSTDVIAATYSLPKDLLAANDQLTVALFYRSGYLLHLSHMYVCVCMYVCMCGG